VRHAWQHGGDPLIGSNGAVRGVGSGRRSRAACSLQPLVGSRASPTHLCHCAAATIDGIRAHVGNPTQIILFRMPVSAGSLHEKTVPNGGSRSGCGCGA